MIFLSKHCKETFYSRLRASRALLTALGHSSTNFLPRQLNEFDLEQYIVDVSISFERSYSIHISRDDRSVYLFFSFFLFSTITTATDRSRVLPRGHRNRKSCLRQSTSGARARSRSGECFSPYYANSDLLLNP